MYPPKFPSAIMNSHSSNPAPQGAAARAPLHMVWPAASAQPARPVSASSGAGTPAAASAGMNLGVTDFLGLAQHPDVRQTVQAAVSQFGVHASTWSPFEGFRDASSMLVSELSALLRMPAVSIFQSGWSAGFCAVRALVEPDDHVVLDALSQIGLYEGAAAATRQVHLCRHLDVEHMRTTLRMIRQGAGRKHSILVVTEALFSADASSPDLRALKDACVEFDAKLCVSVTHDLCALGPGGTGQLGLQGLLGQVDLVVGSFSPVLASSGGFVAAADRSVGVRLSEDPSARKLAGSAGAAQLVTALAALRIARSGEGESLRRDLLTRVAYLRAELATHGGVVLGAAAPMVPILVGWEDACQLAVKLCAEQGVHVQLLEHPEVPVATARLRLNVSATHDVTRFQSVARLIMEAVHDAEHHFDALSLPRAQVTS